MNKRLVREVLMLISQGWRPYNDNPAQEVYWRVGCPYLGAKRGKEPCWFVRGDIFMCVSCPKSCVLSRPEGFRLPLPIRYDESKKEVLRRTPGELVTVKSLLRVDEAAYCLNISERSVYDWIAEGKLRKAIGAPVRVSAKDVAYFMTNFEE
jgi:excisionase family DNA binding protein